MRVKKRIPIKKLQYFDKNIDNIASNSYFLIIFAITK